MKKYILIFVAFIFSILQAHAVKRIEANPINIAVMLTEQLDSAAVASTCEYYGYIIQPSQDDYKIYKHPNGSTIRYKYTTVENGKSYPTIEVKTKVTQKEKDHILKQLNFQKNGSSYQRKSIGHDTSCSSAPEGFLRFSNHPKPKVAD